MDLVQFSWSVIRILLTASSPVVAKKTATAYDRSLDLLLSIPAIPAAVCINNSSEQLVQERPSSALVMGVIAEFFGLVRCGKACIDCNSVKPGA